MRVSAALVGAAVLGAAPACAAIWGFEDGSLARGSDAGSSSSGGGSSSGGPVDSGPDTSTPVPENCSLRELSPDALYVDSFAGTDTGACTAEAPCKNIQYAVEQADATRHTIYLGRGRYAEFRLPADKLGLGLRVEGRWERREGGWFTYCETDPDLLIESTTERGIEVVAPAPDADAGDGEDAAPPAPRDAGDAIDLELAYVAVIGRPPLGASSSYGIFARSTRVSLVGASVAAHFGGDGVSPSNAPPAVTGTDTCPGGTGAMGPSGSALGEGEFGGDGYVPASIASEPAGNGEDGQCPGACLHGRGGLPGTNAGGGGASVAVYLVDAHLLLSDGTGLLAYGGGRGGNGGPGGLGSLGTCIFQGQPAPGGTGGTGSPGPGGPAACVVRAGTSSSNSDLSPTACSLPDPAPGGTGGDGIQAARGRAEAVLP